MDRLSVYSDIDNLAEVFQMDRNSSDFIGMKQFLSKEANITINELQEIAENNEYFAAMANDLVSGDFVINYRTEQESFLDPPFKTNLAEYFEDKGTIFFSYDTERVMLAQEKSGFLMSGIGGEVDVYNQLNFNKDFFRGNKILTIGSNFTKYEDLEQYIIPFNEIIINEPYLFKPDKNDWNLNDYLENNFKPLCRTLLKKVKNKVNITIGTFVNQQGQEEYPFFSIDENHESGKGFQPLYDMCVEFLNSLLGVNKFNLLLVVSPMSRKGRHDRFIVTNYQILDCPAGLAFFDDRGNFISRGEAIHMYSTMHDDARKELIPSVIKNMQEKVIDSVLKTHPERVFGVENGDTGLLLVEDRNV